MWAGILDSVEEVVVAHGDDESLTPQAIDHVWLRLRVGQAAKPTARELGLCTGTVRAYLLRCGGSDPSRVDEPLVEEREEISRGLAAGESMRSIARRLGRTPSTVSRRIAANGGRSRYRMQVSHESIYRTLFVQSRSGLNKELIGYLRTGRAIRRPKGVRVPDGRMVEGADPTP